MLLCIHWAAVVLTIMNPGPGATPGMGTTSPMAFVGSTRAIGYGAGVGWILLFLLWATSRSVVWQTSKAAKLERLASLPGREAMLTDKKSADPNPTG